MKTIILAFAILLAVVSLSSAGFFAGRFGATNGGAGAGGNLQDNTPQDLTDCCGNSLSAR